MFADSSGALAKRRGIVLVVVLGMLGLMALIGVTFATFAGQSLIASRNFGQGVARPQAEALMDFALAQLINDTNNPVSAIRGHSLLRDMYGNDSVFRGSNPTANPVSDLGGVLASVYNAANGTYVPLQMARIGLRTANSHSPSPTPFYNQIQFATNIPITGQYYGLDFTRWIIKIQGSPASNGYTGQTPPGNPLSGYATQTFEVLEDDATGLTPAVGAYHLFTLSNNLTNPTVDPRYVALYNNSTTSVPSDWATFLYVDPNYVSPAIGVQSTTANNTTTYTFTKPSASLAPEWSPNGTIFTLDGRYMRAFNGPGLTQCTAPGFPYNILVYPYNLAAFANFRINGLNPDAYGMDEDYDACDLENWFLALQSADGQVVIPSFHRPGILAASDWTLGASVAQVSKILRPRQIDNSPLFPPDPSAPDSSTGKLTYDIDNDGDGVTDSVWVDLGYSVQRDPGGKLYKPLFAFMVLGLNGRLPLNTVGNLHARANADAMNNINAVDSTSSTLPITTGQVGQPGVYQDQNPSPGVYYKYAYATSNAFFPPTVVSSQAYLDAPLWDHASHLGYSVNEINPKFALQNAPSNLYASPSNINGVSTINVNGSNYSQVDDAGVSVALTQMRNILAGTIPTDLPYPYQGQYPLTIKNTSTGNYDANAVMVNGQIRILPNNMADQRDINPNPNLNQQGPIPPFAVFRSLPPVAGRWGEPSGILQNSTLPPAGLGSYPSPPSGQLSASLAYPGLIYNNPVRAGLSQYGLGTTDIMDDDFDGTDPVLAPQILAAYYYYREPQAPGSTTAYGPIGPIVRGLPEFTDTFDNIGQRAVASERKRHYVTPDDPGGVGRVVEFMSQNKMLGAPPLPQVARPQNDYDYGSGYDVRGRTSYFRYYRVPGMPQDIRYPYGGSGSTYSYPYYFSGGNPPQTYPTGQPVISSYFGHRFLMPQLFPAGTPDLLGYTAAAPLATGASDIHSNRYHGFQSMLTPEWFVPTGSSYPIAGNVQTIASMAAMPFDWDNSLPAAYSMNGTLQNPGPPVGYPHANSTTMGAATFGPPLGTNYVNNFAPTLNPNATISSVNTLSGPNFGDIGNPAGATVQTPISYGYVLPYDPMVVQPPLAPVVNSYLGGSLNKDEADEMNLYAPNRYDMPYGPSDLEWLYRLQDVDGATLTSRLSQLAPVSFLNPADGLTRRRMFSTDSWEPTGWVYANDNPIPYAGAAYGATTDHTYTYNSRFTPYASPSLEVMNQIDGTVSFSNGYASVPTYTSSSIPNTFATMANPITTEFLPNPSFPTISVGQPTSYTELYPNSTSGQVGATLPNALHLNNANMFVPPIIPRVSIGAGLPVNYGGNSMVQVQTPSIAHRDRRINLNFPLPISNDPAEPVRQKWCRETYTLLKAILPPASVDTPEELAALSQFVVNIIDFRDTDCTMTRFVNTDLVVTDALTKTATQNLPQTLPAAPNPMTPVYGYDTTWNVSPAGVRFANSGDTGNNASGANILTTLVNGNPVPTYPYDPNIYTPDALCPFLVQHGMEYNPIAINEVLGLQLQYGTSTSTTGPSTLTPTTGFYVELVNTLTEEQNNNNSTNNASAINLAGWDLIVTPDDYGWGRPDPISGDVTGIAYPPFYAPPAGGSTLAIQPAANNPAVNLTSPLATQVYHFQLQPPATNPNALTIKGINAGTPDYFVIGNGIAANSLESNGAVFPNPQVDFTLPTVAVYSPRPFQPTTVTNGSGKGQYFWVYLRRPANPFDNTALQPDTAQPNFRPNREMVVVDAMRFPFIDAGMATPGVNTVTPPTPAPGNSMYSSRRLQPYRGGHLVPAATVAANPMAPASYTGPLPVPPVTSLANGLAVAASNGSNVTTICPPSPPYAYGYSEQMCPSNPPGNPIYGSFTPLVPTGTGGTKPGTPVRTSGPILETLNQEGIPRDTAWTNFPFLDRNFTSVAELLLVPGCPPGLFTKQFAEEPYPGNVVGSTVTNYVTFPTSGNGPVSYGNNIQYFNTTSTGLDDLSLNPPTGTVAISQPMLPTAVTGAAINNGGNSTIPYSWTYPAGGSMYQANLNANIGRPNFGRLTVPTPPPLTAMGITVPASTPVAPTFPYLPDNFYYTAASVAPAASGGVNYPPYYTHLTTEVGGWTGNGWHKMLEFFEVPSSANGAVGTADGGNNFDWARSDIKPGLLNLNLIIDEEVFAGLFDDPRLNERLAAYAPTNGISSGSSAIPQIVTQVDANGYAAGHYPIFGGVSTNQLNLQPSNGGGVGGLYLDQSTYVNNTNAPGLVNDPTKPNQSPTAFGRGYSVRDPDSQNYVQQTPGAPFPYQYLHGIKAAFSDFLKLRHGGSGYLFAHGAGPTGSGDLVHNNAWPQTQPIAAERPYRSLSYPDINYTIMRPASLPPSQTDSAALPANYRWTASTPALPAPLQDTSLFSYATFSPVNNNSGNNIYVEFTPLFGNAPVAPRNLPSAPPTVVPYQYTADPGIKNPYLPVQYASTLVPNSGPDLVKAMASSAPPTVGSGGPPYPALPFDPTNQFAPSAPFPPPIPPTPAARLIQVPDVDTSAATYPSGIPVNGAMPTPPNPANFTSNANKPGQTVAVPDFPNSNASVAGQFDGSVSIPLNVFNTDGVGNQYAGTNNLATQQFVNSLAVNWPTTTLMLFNGSLSPPTLVSQSRSVFLQDNNTPLASTTYAPQMAPKQDNSNASLTAPNFMVQAAANNHLGAGTPPNQYNPTSIFPNYASVTPAATGLSPTNDYRQHPLYRTELLQKLMNLTTVRTHQYAVWITVGFFEVVKPGTPELGLPDVLGQELGLAAGHNIRYRSFFTLDRTKATGFNPYYPGNFRDCVTYRRRIE